MTFWILRGFTLGPCKFGPLLEEILATPLGCSYLALSCLMDRNWENLWVSQTDHWKCSYLYHQPLHLEH